MKFISALQGTLCVTSLLAVSLVSGNVLAGLPDPGMTIEPGKTALVLTDPQNDFLSPKGGDLGCRWEKRHRQ